MAPPSRTNGMQTAATLCASLKRLGWNNTILNSQLNDEDGIPDTY